MKKTILIGCSTIKPEIEYAMKKWNLLIPCRWLNSGLHDVPVKLKTTLQEAIDEAANDGYERILLGYSFCGMAVSGINSRSCELILPRVDDCITLFLGSPARRRSIPHGGATYYLTWGWLFDQEHLWHDYETYVETYGEETANELMDELLGNYKQIGIINTHCYDMEEIRKGAWEMSKKFSLGNIVEIDSDNRYCEELLTGPWEENRFLIIPPEKTISPSLLTLSYD